MFSEPRCTAASSVCWLRTLSPCFLFVFQQDLVCDMPACIPVYILPPSDVDSISDCRTVQTRHVANHDSRMLFFLVLFHLHCLECVLQTSLLIIIFASLITNACFHVRQTLCLQSERKFQVNFDLQCASVLSTLGYIQPLNFLTQIPSYKLTSCTTRILGGNVLECLLIQLIAYIPLMNARVVAMTAVAMTVH